MHKKRIWITMGCYFFVISLVASAQATLKPGLWETTSTMSWQQSPMLPGMTMPGGGPRTVQVCLTQAMINKYGAPMPQNPNCQISNVMLKTTSMTADWICSGRIPGKGTLEYSWLDGDSAKGKVHFLGSMQMRQNSGTVEYTIYSSSIYKGPDCESVQPQPMQSESVAATLASQDSKQIDSVLSAESPIASPSTASVEAPQDSDLRKVKTDQSLLHPALRTDWPELEQLWNRGLADAARHKRLQPISTYDNRIWGFFMRRIQSGTSSCLLELKGPDLAAYRGGFTSHTDDWNDSLVSHAKSQLHDSLDKGRTKLVFLGIIGITPKFDSSHHVINEANLEQLKDIQIVMRVGKRTYQPVSQPGDLVYKPSDCTYHEFPGSILWDESATIDNYSGQMSETHSGYSQTTNCYKTYTGESSVQAGMAREIYDANRRIEIIPYARESWSGYTGMFKVIFDLFDVDGTARVTPSDTKIDIIVNYGQKISQISYDLKDWERIIHH